MLAWPHDKNSRVIGAGRSGQWATQERNEHRSHIKHYTDTNKQIKVEEQDRLCFDRLHFWYFLVFFFLIITSAKEHM